VTAARVRDGEPAALGALVDRRGSAVLAYCEEVAEPEKTRAAAAEAFARFRREVVAADEPRALDPEAVLLRGTRQAAAKAAARTVPARGMLARRLGTTCVLVPELLAARAEGSLTAADRLRLSHHLERCEGCREAEERFAAGERAYHEAPSAPPPPEVADQMLAALRDAAPTVDAETEPAAAEPDAAVVAEGNGSPRPVIDQGETLAWDAADVAAATGDASERRGARWILLRFALPLVVFVAAFVIALAVAGVFSDKGSDPAGSIETQSDEPPSAIRVHSRPVTTPLPEGASGAVRTAPPSETASATVDNTIVVTSRNAAVAPRTAQPEPQLRAQARSRSEAAAPPPEQSAPAATDPAFQPAAP
jgi:anti-sigma factor RsiW